MSLCDGLRAFFNSLPATECLKLSTAMKNQTYAFALATAVAAIAVPAWVSAVECTAAQIDAIENRDFTSVKNACPSFSDAGEAANPGNYDTFTNESLAKITSCKEKPCIAALTKVYDDTPDCMDHNTSAKVFYAAAIKVCKAFDGGPLNKENATAIYFEAATKEWNTLKSRDSPTSTTPRPLNSTGETSTNSSTISPPPSSPPPATPATTVKSATSVASGAGIAVGTTTAFA